MNRAALVYLYDQLAGRLFENDEGYIFMYDETFLQQPAAMPISLTLPLRTEAFGSNTLFPFFDGLIPEGWLMERALETWKLNPRDRMGLLLAACRDCIGATSIIPIDLDAS